MLRWANVKDQKNGPKAGHNRDGVCEHCSCQCIETGPRSTNLAIVFPAKSNSLIVEFTRSSILASTAAGQHIENVWNTWINMRLTNFGCIVIFCVISSSFLMSLKIKLLSSKKMDDNEQMKTALVLLTEGTELCQRQPTGAGGKPPQFSLTDLI